MSYLLATATTLAAAISGNSLGLRADQSDLLHDLSRLEEGVFFSPSPQCSCLQTAELQRSFALCRRTNGCEALQQGRLTSVSASMLYCHTKHISPPRADSHLVSQLSGDRKLVEGLIRWESNLDKPRETQELLLLLFLYW